MSDLSEEYDEVGWLAVALAPVSMRDSFAAAFALDHRLSRVASKAKEPMLAQIRLAWWRDRLGEDMSVRPKGDIVLDAIGRNWHGEEESLRALIDGWEQAVGEIPGPAEARHLADAKGRCFASLARLAGCADDAPKAAQHGRAWGYASIAVLSDRRRKVCAAYLDEEGRLPGLPRPLKPVALVGKLSRRALLRGGEPLIGDRTSPLAAARIAMFGR